LYTINWNEMNWITLFLSIFFFFLLIFATQCDVATQCDGLRQSPPRKLNIEILCSRASHCVAMSHIWKINIYFFKNDLSLFYFKYKWSYSFDLQIFICRYIFRLDNSLEQYSHSIVLFKRQCIIKKIIWKNNIWYNKNA